MSLLGDVLSTINQPSTIIGARDNDMSGILNYEDGGIALSDPSEGHSYQIWTGSLVGNDIILDSPETSPETIYTTSGMTEFDFTFDQNMRPVLAFVQSGVAKLRWYDSTIEAYAVSEIGDNTSSPKVILDDKRTLEDTTSDVILAYILDRDAIVDGVLVVLKDLYFRMQRDRFLVSYLLKEDIVGDIEQVGIVGELKKIGMGENLRLQFVII